MIIPHKKGRDLYDFWYTLNHHPNIDIKLVLDIFQYYMAFGNTPVTVYELKQNLELKRNDRVFNKDIFSLLDTDQAEQYKMADIKLFDAGKITKAEMLDTVLERAKKL